MLKERTVAPNFILPDQDGIERALRDYRGSWILLYFYPKDDTPGCTKEACMIRDVWEGFRALSVVVLGVSVDSSAKHKKFIEKYQLPFTLLSDAEKEVVKLYEVWGEKKFMGRTYMGTRRSSYLIDPKGKIFRVFEKVDPAGHAQEILDALKEKTS